MKRLRFLIAAFLVAMFSAAGAQSVFAPVLLSKVTAQGAGSYAEPRSPIRTFHASGSTSSGAGSVTVVVQGSNDTSLAPASLCTIIVTLSTTEAADGCVTQSPWKYVRGNVTAISGTGATVTLVMGEIR